MIVGLIVESDCFEREKKCESDCENDTSPKISLFIKVDINNNC